MNKYVKYIPYAIIGIAVGLVTASKKIQTKTKIAIIALGFLLIVILSIILQNKNLAGGIENGS